MTKVTTTTKAPRRPRRSPGEGSVFKDGDGYRAQLRLDDETVLRQRGRTKSEARAKLERAKAKLAFGLPVGSTEAVGPYLEWWLTMAKAKVGTGVGEMSPNTWDNYAWALGIAGEALQKYRLSELEPEHVEALLARLARDGMSRQASYGSRRTSARPSRRRFAAGRFLATWPSWR